MFEHANDLLTVNETAKLLRMDRGGLYPLLLSGKLKGFRNERVWRISKEALIQYVRDSSSLN